MPLHLEVDGLDLLIDELKKRDFEVVGPKVRNEAIVYDQVASSADLPIGWTDDQEAARYRIKRGDPEKGGDKTRFGFVVGPHAWKRYLHPPEQLLWEAEQNGNDVKIDDDVEPPSRRAFLGVRGCELAAIKIHDKVFLENDYVDDGYKKRRENTFIVAVNCTTVGGTCFCVSMKTGPRVGNGFDLALTEVANKDSHYFLVECGSDIGAQVLVALPTREATEAEVNAADDAISEVEGKMGRTLDTNGLKEHLYASLEHPHWQDIAKRCMSCSNCRLVCPTCFCTSVEESTDLMTNTVQRVRKWDSCFTAQFSYIHGGVIRKSTASRYRQWLTHKLASWVDQFGTSGCVGCGRCITWCPVGIDITEEVSALRVLPAKASPGS